MRRPLLLCALAATLPLGGCVAALIPLAAGGALATSSRGESVAQKAAPAPDAVASALETGEPLPESWTMPDGSTAQVIAATALPVPGPARERVGGYDGFREAALALAAQSGEARSSALLAEPGEPVTARCGEEPPAILLDLDPPGALFETDALARSNNALAGVLAELRARGVEVFWISGRSAADAGAVQKALRTSGLDPAGDDMLLLMRYPDDRKQTRRLDIANTHCLLAIAGDEREDFEEMFEYLRNPDTPTVVDSLIGTRWFLTPNPLF